MPLPQPAPSARVGRLLAPHATQRLAEPGPSVRYLLRLWALEHLSGPPVFDPRCVGLSHSSREPCVLCRVSARSPSPSHIAPCCVKSRVVSRCHNCVTSARCARYSRALMMRGSCYEWRELAGAKMQGEYALTYMRVIANWRAEDAPPPFSINYDFRSNLT